MRFFYVNWHKFGFQISGFVKRYNSPGATSRTNSAPIEVRAQLSEARTQALSRFPMQSGF